MKLYWKDREKIPFIKKKKTCNIKGLEYSGSRDNVSPKSLILAERMSGVCYLV